MLKKWLPKKTAQNSPSTTASDGTVNEKNRANTRKWTLGILSDPQTDEVPGSVIILSRTYKRNEPLGLQHAHARNSSSSLPSPLSTPTRSRSRSSRRSRRSSRAREAEKKSKDGKFVLVPQPDDSANDPLNWPTVRRDAALLSLGLYCMIGGGMTPILAAGFNNVADTYNVSVPKVALTTGLYMLGLGLGSVITSPTAILWGKRPVYLTAIIIFALTAVWCAASPTYVSLLIARIVQGIAVSPVECLPSATIAEIFFLHERAYRLGIYTLLLLGGKNLIPLVSAAIIESLGWRWVFWIVAIVVGSCFFLIFFFVPETFWDRTPRPRERRPARKRSQSPGQHHHHHNWHIPKFGKPPVAPIPLPGTGEAVSSGQQSTLQHGSGSIQRPPRSARVGFADDAGDHDTAQARSTPTGTNVQDHIHAPSDHHQTQVGPSDQEGSDTGFPFPTSNEADNNIPNVEQQRASLPYNSSHDTIALNEETDENGLCHYYTSFYREAPPKSYVQSLNPWNGRLVDDKWVKVMFRPFILFAYPAVLWSSMVYALAVGWLIVLSESVSHIYKDRESYNFTSLQVGLVYISPFVGGVLGTAVAGKISDIIVRFMARRNDGVYEPEFRLTMAIPITLSTTIGLMGFGWSAQEKDSWIVPTVFFGVISFGCCLASTTAVTFVVDSYRVYAGEALVTLNFCKNILHGFIFSLFFPHWLEADGAKSVFLAVGGIQLGCMLLSIPMYIFGKRARMWTVRKNLMEKF
ncbi:MFS general substrate transporter [Aaosphaeria arxii CBS 175.79]|uniref:MFS general substrate transporter n=1 Tax=Aaosphaeria arxii CBS 175.79 TaxID=1450172 RepID=A0A6A5Y870_9PLEO|nr:MFS general substrate transporter [Aaosphaeria arxii CBS 175.79]KAF2021755.1 MFS general substrate transporter [Aaosphaeria arxii CBS 175.79]